MNTRHAMKASELIAVLQKRIDEFGDLEISVNTQDGAAYSLFDVSDVHLISGITRNGEHIDLLEIG